MDISTVILTAGTLLAITLGGVIVRRMVIPRVERIAEKTNNRIDDILLSVLRVIKLRSYMILGVLAALSVGMPESFGRVTDAALLLFLGFEVTRILFHVVDILIQEYIRKFNIEKEAIATIIPTMGILIKVGIAMVISVFVLSNLGVNVIPLITGLGVAGMAAAFALKNIIADLFSAFVIFLDKPFSVGNFIKVGSVSGTVEHVGIKTTDLRAGTGEKIIIPNRELVDAQIINSADLSQRKIALRIPVAYDTSTEKLSDMSKGINDIILSHTNTKVKTVAVAEFSGEAVILEAVYLITGVTYDEHIEIRHAIYLAILEKMKENGINPGYTSKYYLQK